ncbi:STE/STE7 protein kinase [Mycena kentingensis (nom. inval.)]|nr:STE/STE7 protein kinase [Mycena kentingensis (nom. inval.)]
MADTAAQYTANDPDAPGFFDFESLLSTLESPLAPMDVATEPDDDLDDLSLIGRGDTGTVHRVKDKRTGTIFARKTIETRVEPMKNLLRLLSAVSAAPHENIISFHGARIPPSRSKVHILMEYCEGGSLASVSQRLKEIHAILGEGIGGRLAHGILSGLAFLHTNDIIHSNLKPSNILLTRDGVVKLSDCGLWGVLEASLTVLVPTDSFYMAPERIAGLPYTAQSDVWSAGICLLEAFQQRFPYPENLPPIELLMLIVAGEPPKLEDEGELVWSSELKDFIRQMCCNLGSWKLRVDLCNLAVGHSAHRAELGDDSGERRRLVILQDANNRSATRSTVAALLTHPWMEHAVAREIHMDKWIRKVWGWPKQRTVRDQ